MDSLSLAKQFVAAVERGDTEEISGFLADGVLHEEFPNQFVPAGATRDKAAILEAGLRGRRVMRSQTYDVVNALADRLHVEVARDRQLWVQDYARGKPRGPLKAAGPVTSSMPRVGRNHWVPATTVGVGCGLAGLVADSVAFGELLGVTVEVAVEVM